MLLHTLDAPTTSNIISSLSLLTALTALCYSYKQMRVGRDAAEYAKRSALAAEESAAASREAVALGNRPYLTVQRVEITNRVDLDIPMGVRIVISNSGTTPALDIICQAWMRAFDVLPGEIPHHDGKTFPQSDLGAGDKFEIAVRGGENYDMKATQIVQQRSTILLYGQARYKDVSGHRHELNWRYKYLPRPKEFHPDRSTI
jgi:hypothetical protein